MKTKQNYFNFFTLFKVIIIVLLLVSNYSCDKLTGDQDDNEPNNSFTEATVLPLNTAEKAYIDDVDDNDYYKFNSSNTDVWNSYTVFVTDVESSLSAALEGYDTKKSSTGTIGVNGEAGIRDYGADVEHTIYTKENFQYLRFSGWDAYINDHKSTGSYVIKVVENPNDSYEPDNTFEDSRVINSFPSGELYGVVLVNAANDNDGDYEFFKMILSSGKKVEWIIDPSASNTTLIFDVYSESLEHKGTLSGNSGQTLAGSMNNPGTVDTEFYIRLGAFVGDNGDYTISFTEVLAE